MSECYSCKKEGKTVRIRLVRCADVCRCEDDIPLCDPCANDPENPDQVDPEDLRPE